MPVHGRKLHTGPDRPVTIVMDETLVSLDKHLTGAVIKCQIHHIRDKDRLYTVVSLRKWHYKNYLQQKLYLADKFWNNIQCSFMEGSVSTTINWRNLLRTYRKRKLLCTETTEIWEINCERPGPEVIKLFLCSTQLSMKF